MTNKCSMCKVEVERTGYKGMCDACSIEYFKR